MAINPFEPFLLSIVTGLLSLLVVFPSMYLLKDHLRATFCQHCCAALFALYRVAIGSRTVYNDLHSQLLHTLQRTTSIRGLQCQSTRCHAELRVLAERPTW